MALQSALEITLGLQGLINFNVQVRRAKDKPKKIKQKEKKLVITVLLGTTRERRSPLIIVVLFALVSIIFIDQILKLVAVHSSGLQVCRSFYLNLFSNLKSRGPYP